MKLKIFTFRFVEDAGGFDDKPTPDFTAADSVYVFKRRTDD
jgi:hypothetical protein